MPIIRNQWNSMKIDISWNNDNASYYCQCHLHIIAHDPNSSGRVLRDRPCGGDGKVAHRTSLLQIQIPTLRLARMPPTPIWTRKTRCLLPPTPIWTRKTQGLLPPTPIWSRKTQCLLPPTPIWTRKTQCLLPPTLIWTRVITNPMLMLML